MSEDEEKEENNNSNDIVMKHVLFRVIKLLSWGNLSKANANLACVVSPMLSSAKTRAKTILIDSDPLRRQLHAGHSKCFFPFFLTFISTETYI